MEGKYFLTRNFLPDPTGAVLLGPAVLRAAFGTCEEEIRPRFFPTFPELREFLREVKVVCFHILVFIVCQIKMEYCVPLLAFPSPSVQGLVRNIHLVLLCKSLCVDHILQYRDTGCNLRLLHCTQFGNANLRGF